MSDRTDLHWSATTGVQSINGVSQGTPVDNHIFETIWTGGATSTYDLSNFSQSQVDDMNPGSWMLFSTGQLPISMRSLRPSDRRNLCRAISSTLEFNGDARSLIDNLSSGSGNDTITGNAANNAINAARQ